MSTVIFVKEDTTTQGSWYSGSKPIYGRDGYGIIGQGASADGTIPVTTGYFNYPAYATVNLAGDTADCYANTSSDVRALEYAPPGTSDGSDSNRVAAVWYSVDPNSFTIDVQDGSAHQIALYMFDWENAGRIQQIQMTDDNNGNAVLDTRTVSSFGNGVWMVWIVAGKVTFTITPEVSATSAVIAGIFFDTPFTVSPPLIVSPRFEPAWYE